MEARRLLVGKRRPVRLAPDDALKAHALHQPRNRAAGDVEAFPPQLLPDLAHAIDPPVLLEGCRSGLGADAGAEPIGREPSGRTNLAVRRRHDAQPALRGRSGHADARAEVVMAQGLGDEHRQRKAIGGGQGLSTSDGGRPAPTFL